MKRFVVEKTLHLGSNQCLFFFQEELLESMKAKNRTLSHELEEYHEKVESLEAQMARRGAGKRIGAAGRSRQVSQVSS